RASQKSPHVQHEDENEAKLILEQFRPVKSPTFKAGLVLSEQAQRRRASRRPQHPLSGPQLPRLTLRIAVGYLGGVRALGPLSVCTGG
ncbi:MAG: hypothetical protein AB7K24_21770, partial [Gemmataceae bacterium]